MNIKNTRTWLRISLLSTLILLLLFSAVWIRSHFVVDQVTIQFGTPWRFWVVPGCGVIHTGITRDPHIVSRGIHYLKKDPKDRTPPAALWWSNLPSFRWTNYSEVYEDGRLYRMLSISFPLWLPVGILSLASCILAVVAVSTKARNRSEG